MPLDEDVVRPAKGRTGHRRATARAAHLGRQAWLLVNTEPQRQRVKNIRPEPPITVLIHTKDNPWDWAEMRGKVVGTTGGREARDHIDALPRKYVGTDYQNPVGPEGRVILRIDVDKVNTPATVFARQR